MGPVKTKRERQQHILDLLARNRVDSQDELQDLLLAEGVETTQSTLSRDLRDLGILKDESGYHPPERNAARPDRLRALAEQITPRLLSTDRGHNLAVLRTLDSQSAIDVASSIERAELHQIVAALPCAAAVLVVARTQAYAREIVRCLRDRPRRVERSRTDRR